MQSDQLHSALSPVIHGDIALSITTMQNTKKYNYENKRIMLVVCTPICPSTERLVHC